MAANNLNRIKIEIMGEDYTVKTNESTEYISELAAYVDELLETITNRNIHIGKTKAAILGCLIMADEVFKLEAALEKEKNSRSTRKSGPNKTTD